MSALYDTDFIRDHNEFTLASLAEVHTPAFLSAGSKWLLRIRDNLADVIGFEQAEGGRYNTDAITEDADALVPIYTDDVWAIFTDLRAWQVDTLSDYGVDVDDLTAVARTALFVIAERLIVALLDAAKV